MLSEHAASSLSLVDRYTYFGRLLKIRLFDRVSFCFYYKGHNSASRRLFVLFWRP